MINSRKHVGNTKRRVGKAGQRNGVAGPKGNPLAIGIALRRAEYFQLTINQIQNPVFRHFCFRVDAEFVPAVMREACSRDLDQEVGVSRVLFEIVPVLAFHYGEVRFRLRSIRQGDGRLRANDPPILVRVAQRRRNQFQGRYVFRIVWRHIDKFPLNEFDPQAGIKSASTYHSLELFSRPSVNHWIRQLHFPCSYHSS